MNNNSQQFKGRAKGGGGSALKNLKASLKDAGVLGPKMKKARTAAQHRQAAEGRKGVRSTLDQLSKSKSNPFELQFTKPKHDVLGRKVKGAVGKPMAQRRKAEATRKSTLGIELKRKNKSAAFVDRRFGESDPTMSLEDKMMERFMREKLKSGGRGASIFNLEDDELTHKGKSINDMDDFEDIGNELADSDDDGQIDKHTVKVAHFGGFDDVSPADSKRSRNEIMQEVIAKSKFYKLERQKQNEEVAKLSQEVDADLDDIRALLGAANSTGDAEDSLKRKRAPLPSQMEDYDKFVRELRTEARAAPSNRMKSEEELVMKEKEKLEMLERERKRRMMGLPSEKEGKSKSRSKRAPQADDLGDDYVTENQDSYNIDDNNDDEEGEEDEERLSAAKAKPLEYKDGVLVNKTIFMRKRKASELEKDQEEQDDDVEEDEEEDDDGEDEADNEDEDKYEDEEVAEEDSDIELGEGDDDDEGEEDEDADELDAEEAHLEQTDFEAGEFDENSEIRTGEANEDLSVKAAETSNKFDANAGTIDEVPYTFTAPESYDDFLEIMNGYTPEQHATILHRIRVLYHVKLGGSNRTKLETLLSLIFEYISNFSAGHVTLATVNAIMRHIHEMAVQFPGLAANLCLKRIKKMHARVVKAENKSDALPWLEDLVLLKLVARLFSVSDMEHIVGTPTALVISEFLSQCWFRNVRQVVSTLVLCQICYEYQKVAKRFVPEVISSLLHIFEALVRKSDFGMIRISNYSAPYSKLDLEASIIRGWESKNDDSFRLSLLAASIETLTQFIRLYSDVHAFSEVFGQYVPILESIPTAKLHGEFKDRLKSCNDLLTGLMASAKLKRRPLELQKRKPIPIATYVPKFQEHYSYDKKKYDMDKDRVEAQKLKTEYKREMKGAMRELRKDSQFVARARLQERQEKASEHKKKMDVIMGNLANQEGAMRGFEKMAGKKRRR